MNTQYKLLLVVLLCLTAPVAFAQKNAPLTWGKVSVGDFKQSEKRKDKSARAVILADVGTTQIKFNVLGEAYLEFKRQCRIHILHKSAFDAANIEIPIYIDKDAFEKLNKVQAATYNLVSGKVEVVKLDNKDVFKEAINKNWANYKFTLPNVQEGSIVEFSYVLTSEFLFNLQSWTFQREYPTLWSEYEVVIPDRLEYLSLLQGYVSPYITTTTSSRMFSENYTTRRWVLKDVAALKEEKFTSTVNNHVAKIEFQLSRIRNQMGIPIHIMSDWDKVNKSMMDDENFGLELKKNNNWLQNQIKLIKGESKDPLEVAGKIYAYVRDNFTCTQNSGLFTKTTLKNVMSAKSGTVAEINLLLCAMLEYEKLTASPVILSTRARGLTHPIYPIMSRYNYLICELKLKDDTYYLDASMSELPFGKLDPQCYNGHARVMGKDCRSINLYADQLMYESKTIVFIGNGEKSGEVEGAIQQQIGYLGSINIRRELKNKDEAAYFKDLTKDIAGMEVVRHSLGNIDDKEKAIILKYDFKMKAGGGLLYFNPFMTERFSDNPFTSAERYYPVEMPYGMKFQYTLNMEVPEGYVVEELPKSVRVLLNEGESKFEFRIQQQDQLIQLVSILHISRATYFNEEYDSLRNFFSEIIKKHQESIVFKKI